MALMEVNFFSKALMRPVTMNVILPADKVFFEEETEEDLASSISRMFPGISFDKE